MAPPTETRYYDNLNRYEPVNNVDMNCDLDIESTCIESDSVMTCNMLNDKVIPVQFSADCTLTIKVGGTEYVALIDSGSSINIMSTQILNVIPHSCLKQKPYHNSLYIKSVNGSTSDIVGCFMLQFNVGPHECCSDFYVADKIGSEIILGRPFLKGSHAVIDFNYYTICLYGPFSVNIDSQDMYIGAGQQVFTVGSVKDNAGRGLSMTGLVGVVRQINEDNAIKINETIVTMANGKVPLMVTNGSKEMVQLNGPSNIIFEPVSAEDTLHKFELHDEPLSAVDLNDACAVFNVSVQQKEQGNMTNNKLDDLDKFPSHYDNRKDPHGVNREIFEHYDNNAIDLCRNDNTPGKVIKGTNLKTNNDLSGKDLEFDCKWISQSKSLCKGNHDNNMCTCSASGDCFNAEWAEVGIKKAQNNDKRLFQCNAVELVAKFPVQHFHSSDVIGIVEQFEKSITPTTNVQNRPVTHQIEVDVHDMAQLTQAVSEHGCKKIPSISSQFAREESDTHEKAQTHDTCYLHSSQVTECCSDSVRGTGDKLAHTRDSPSKGDSIGLITQAALEGENIVETLGDEMCTKVTLLPAAVMNNAGGCSPRLLKIGLNKKRSGKMLTVNSQSPTEPVIFSSNEGQSVKGNANGRLDNEMGNPRDNLLIDPQVICIDTNPDHADIKCINSDSDWVFCSADEYTFASITTTPTKSDVEGRRLSADLMTRVSDKNLACDQQTKVVKLGSNFEKEKLVSNLMNDNDDENLISDLINDNDDENLITDLININGDENLIGNLSHIVTSPVPDVNNEHLVSDLINDSDNEKLITNSSHIVTSPVPDLENNQLVSNLMNDNGDENLITHSSHIVNNPVPDLENEHLISDLMNDSDNETLITNSLHIVTSPVPDFGNKQSVSELIVDTYTKNININSLQLIDSPGPDIENEQLSFEINANTSHKSSGIDNVLRVVSPELGDKNTQIYSELRSNDSKQSVYRSSDLGSNESSHDNSIIDLGLNTDSLAPGTEFQTVSENKMTISSHENLCPNPSTYNDSLVPDFKNRPLHSNFGPQTLTNIISKDSQNQSCSQAPISVSNILHPYMDTKDHDVCGNHKTCRFTFQSEIVVPPTITYSAVVIDTEDEHKDSDLYEDFFDENESVGSDFEMLDDKNQQLVYLDSSDDEHDIFNKYNPNIKEDDNVHSLNNDNTTYMCAQINETDKRKFKFGPNLMYTYEDTVVMVH